MSGTASIIRKIQEIPDGQPFTAKHFCKDNSSRAAIDKALSRLVNKGEIERVTRGVYVKPKTNNYIGKLAPDIEKVIELLRTEHKETLQVHGAEAARIFNLSTQMPITRVFYTNRTSRSVRIGNQIIKLIHTSCARKLLHAGTPVGTALSALWYIGKESVDHQVIRKIQVSLSGNDFNKLKNCEMPLWMHDAFRKFDESNING